MDFKDINDFVTKLDLQGGDVISFDGKTKYIIYCILDERLELLKISKSMDIDRLEKNLGSKNITQLSRLYNKNPELVEKNIQRLKLKDVYDNSAFVWKYPVEQITPRVLIELKNGDEESVLLSKIGNISKRKKSFYVSLKTKNKKFQCLEVTEKCYNNLKNILM